MRKVNVSWIPLFGLLAALVHFLFQVILSPWDEIPTFLSIVFVMALVLFGGFLGWMYHFISVVKDFNSCKISFRQHLIELDFLDLVPFADFNDRIALLNAARLIAREHADVSKDILLSYSANSLEEVHLVTISTAVPACKEVLPFRFNPDPPDIPYKYTVILLHPDDWNLVVSGKLQLPPTYKSPLIQVWPIPNNNETSEVHLAAT